MSGEIEMQIKQFIWDVVDSNSFLITEDNHGLLIDAVDSLDLYDNLDYIDDLVIILTHSHFDHICGLNQIRTIKPNAIVYATRKCSFNIGNQYKNMSSSANAFMTFYSNTPFNASIEPFRCEPVDVVFEDELRLGWNSHDILLTAYHGHSNDSLIAVLNHKYMFSGDTLLSIPTVTRFPGGNTARFWEEDIPKLQRMNIEKVFPGHGAPGTLEDMISVNVKLQK